MNDADGQYGKTWIRALYAEVTALSACANSVDLEDPGQASEGPRCSNLLLICQLRSSDLPGPSDCPQELLEPILLHPLYRDKFCVLLASTNMLHVLNRQLTLSTLRFNGQAIINVQQ